MRSRLLFLALMSPLGLSAPAFAANGFPGIIQESSISSLHRAIVTGEITCTQIIESYLARIEAYNGQCTEPASDPRASLPGYAGPVMDGYWGAIRSDPERQTLYGNFKPSNNGQLNALLVTNVRGERSATCAAECDVAGTDPLPEGCPAVCEASRRLPDALEEAMALDATYGRFPPLHKMPLYCIPFSSKDTIDSSQMRSTGGGDVVYAHDRAAVDATVVARTRAAGGIMLAQANLNEYNAGFGSPNGLPGLVFGGNGSTVAGHLCNPYDTSRSPGSSSGGSGSSVGANLVVCSYCEETGGSCRNPGNVNGSAVMMGSAGFLSKYGLNPGSRIRDRIGIICRSVDDLNRVASVIEGYDPLSTESTDYVFQEFKAPSPLELMGRPSLRGVKLGIVREHMVPWTPNDRDRVEKFNAELKVLQALGAELVESVDPEYVARMGDDPAIPNMTTDFNDAIAKLLPYYAPSYAFMTKANGDPEFPSVASFSTDRVDTAVALYFGDLPLPASIAEGQLNLRRMQSFDDPNGEFKYALNIYLRQRGDAKITDFDALNADTNFLTDKLLDADEAYSIDPSWPSDDRQNFLDHASWPEIENDPIQERVSVKYVLTQATAMVMADNGLSALINPLSTLPPSKLAWVGDPAGPGLRPGTRFPLSADLGIPEIVVPMGFSNVVCDAVPTASSDGTRVSGAAGKTCATLPGQGLPFGMSFWSGPGQEATLLRISSAYERASRRRAPPTAFGPVPGQL